MLERPSDQGARSTKKEKTNDKSKRELELCSHMRKYEEKCKYGSKKGRVGA